MKIIINIISGFIITYTFMMILGDFLYSDSEHLLFKTILYVISLFASTYYFVVRHLVEE